MNIASEKKRLLYCAIQATEDPWFLSELAESFKATYLHDSGGTLKTNHPEVPLVMTIAVPAGSTKWSGRKKMRRLSLISHRK